MDSDEGDQEDPLTIHKYTFVSNNPLNLNDPAGNDPDVAEINISFDAGSILSAEPHLIPYGLNSLGFSPEDQFKNWLFDFKTSAALEGVDFTTLVTLGWSESGTPIGWNRNATNTSGDVGIMQINSHTHPGLAVKEPDVDNIDNGAKLLSGFKNKSAYYESLKPPHISVQKNGKPYATYLLTAPFLTAPELNNDWFVAVWQYKGVSGQGRKNADTWLDIFNGWPGSLNPEYRQLWINRNSFLNN